MPLEASILKSTKKILGLDAGYTAFDLDVMTHINTAFFKLQQLGIGPPEGFMIESDDELWAEFVDGDMNLNSVKTYIYLKVKSLFDPPGTPHHITALNEQITELEHGLKIERELAKWSPPDPDLFTNQVVLDGGVG